MRTHVVVSTSQIRIENVEIARLRANGAIGGMSLLFLRVGENTARKGCGAPPGRNTGCLSVDLNAKSTGGARKASEAIRKAQSPDGSKRAICTRKVLAASLSGIEIALDNETVSQARGTK